MPVPYNEKSHKRKKIHHKDRDDLTLEFPFWDQIQVIIIITFLGIWICDTFIFHYSTFLTKYIPIYIRIVISATLFFIGCYLSHNGIKIVFKEVRTPPAVIEKSVFSIVRHPLYLASMLCYLALIVYSLSIMCFIYFIIIVFIHDHAAAYEEKKLQEKYGDKYIAYMKKVPKWIPQPGKK